MKNNSSLYFDIWRKRNFKNLIEAYIDTGANHSTKKEMILAFGYALDKYVEGGRGSYQPTEKQWSTVYILGRELGVFYTKNATEGYNLSPLAERVLNKEISLEEYLTTYFINFNQLINGEVVHPLKELLLCLGDNNGKVTIENIQNIQKFNLTSKPINNQKQVVNVLIHRLMEAEILKKEESNYMLKKYKFSELFDSLNIYQGTASEFGKLKHENFVDLLSKKTNLIGSHIVEDDLENEINDGLFKFKF